MIKEFIENAKNMDKKIFKIMISGFKFSFIVCIMSCILSLSYILNPISYILYKSGIILFKTGLTFGVMFFVCAFAMDRIKKEMT